MIIRQCVFNIFPCMRLSMHAFVHMNFQRCCSHKNVLSTVTHVNINPPEICGVFGSQTSRSQIMCETLEDNDKILSYSLESRTGNL